MTDNPKIKIVCGNCGSTDVTADGPLHWSIEKQEWVSNGDTYDDLTCQTCGYDGRHFDDVPVDDESDENNDSEIVVGSVVFWTDPDNGTCSGEFIVKGIDADGLMYLSQDDGDCTQAHRHEVRLVKQADPPEASDD